MKTWFVLVPICCVLFTGCAAFSPPVDRSVERPPVPEPTPDAGAYRLEILAMDLSLHAKNLLYSNIERYAEQIFNAPETVAIPVPAFYLQPGKSQEVDAREFFSYPETAGGDVDSEEAQWTEKAVGLHARAALEIADDGKPVVELKIEDSNPVIMEPVLEEETATHYRPVVNRFSFEGRARVPVGRWHVMSGGSTEVERKSLAERDRIERRDLMVWRIVLARLFAPGEHPGDSAAD